MGHKSRVASTKMAERLNQEVYTAQPTYTEYDDNHSHYCSGNYQSYNMADQRHMDILVSPPEHLLKNATMYPPLVVCVDSSGRESLTACVSAVVANTNDPSPVSTYNRGMSYVGGQISMNMAHKPRDTNDSRQFAVFPNLSFPMAGNYELQILIYDASGFEIARRACERSTQVHVLSSPATAPGMCPYQRSIQHIY